MNKKREIKVFQISLGSHLFAHLHEFPSAPNLVMVSEGATSFMFKGSS